MSDNPEFIPEESEDDEDDKEEEGEEEDDGEETETYDVMEVEGQARSEHVSIF